jgi:hypothetical protein
MTVTMQGSEQPLSRCRSSAYRKVGGTGVVMDLLCR